MPSIGSDMSDFLMFMFWIIMAAWLFNWLDKRHASRLKPHASDRNGDKRELLREIAKHDTHNQYDKYGNEI